MYTTVNDVIDRMSRHFNPQKSANVTAKYKIEIPDTGFWVIAVSKGILNIRSAYPEESADCELKISSEDFLDIANEKLTLQLAYMTGKLEISGSLTAAVDLGKLFPKEE